MSEVINEQLTLVLNGVKGRGRAAWMVKENADEVEAFTFCDFCKGQVCLRMNKLNGRGTVTSDSCDNTGCVRANTAIKLNASGYGYSVKAG